MGKREREGVWRVRGGGRAWKRNRAGSGGALLASGEGKKKKPHPDLAWTTPRHRTARRPRQLNPPAQPPNHTARGLVRPLAVPGGRRTQAGGLGVAGKRGRSFPHSRWRAAACFGGRGSLSLLYLSNSSPLARLPCLAGGPGQQRAQARLHRALCVSGSTNRGVRDEKKRGVPAPKLDCADRSRARKQRLHFSVSDARRRSGALRATHSLILLNTTHVDSPLFSPQWPAARAATTAASRAAATPTTRRSRPRPPARLTF